MLLDENGAKFLIMLTVALTLVIIAVAGYCLGLLLEWRDVNRENRALRQYIARTKATNAELHAEYRAEFERRMKQNTADPARHVKKEPYV